MTYSTNAKIPTAAVTIEDAEMLQRMQNRGQQIILQLVMNGTTTVPTPAYSRNVIAEIPGALYPEEVVIVSGHIDSWDVGQGAMDDGGGAYVSWEALSVISHLGLKPNRTIRLIMWTSEEFGGQGAQAYTNAHMAEMPNISLAIESDIGTFNPTGFLFAGSNESLNIMSTIASELLTRINATVVQPAPSVATDVDYLVQEGVPGLSLEDNYTKDHYFWYHHSNGDTITVLNPKQLDKCAAALAVMVYTVANLETLLPRNSTLN